MSIAVVRTLPEEEWRRFVEAQPAGNIFHTPEMFQVFAEAKGYQPTLWATVDDNGHPLALLLPVQVTLMGWPLRQITTRAIAYGSVLYDSSPTGEEALAVLLQTYRQEMRGKALFTELRNLSDLSAVRPVLDDCGFVYEDHLNYLIDLSHPPEAIFQSIGSRTRKNIRRGLKRGEVVCEEVKEQGQVATCYELLHQTYQAARVPLADLSLFEAAFALLHLKGMVRFTLAYVEQVPAAASVELLYKDVVYGWYGGVDRAYSAYVPNELLMWHILEWSAGNGYRVYDFGGAGKPDEEYGVRDFKAKFGGQLVCYGRHTFVHTPALLAISKRAYQIYQDLKRVKSR
jgi:serine/alanine adding enzyme